MDKEYKDDFYIKEAIFKQCFDASRTLDGVERQIESLKNDKSDVESKETLLPYDKKYIKSIRNQIHKLVIFRSKLPDTKILETPRDRWGIPIKDKKQVIEFKEKSYVYKPEQKKKTGSGDKRRKIESVINKKAIKKSNEKW